MDGARIALITGANKGIGLETARQLGKQGVTVLIGARDERRGRDAAEALAREGLTARSVTLDVTSAESIRSCAAWIEREYSRLDILVNNAGISIKGDGPASRVPPDALREVFDTNFFGLVAVTQAMLPLLKRSPAARIVNLSSILGSLAEHADPNSTIYGHHVLAYNASKAAVNMFTVHLAQELRDTKIKVNAAHPGWVRTDMGGNEAPLDVAEGARTSVWLATLPESGPTGGYYHKDVHMRW